MGVFLWGFSIGGLFYWVVYGRYRGSIGQIIVSFTPDLPAICALLARYFRAISLMFFLSFAGGFCSIIGSAVANLWGL